MSRIGIVLVHGNGEQRRLEHLSNEVRDLLAALDANPDLRCTVDAGSTGNSAVGASQGIPPADAGAPVRIDIRFVGGERAGQGELVEVHEVWWADLVDRATLWSRVRSWLWGIGMWRAKRFRRAHLPGAAGMRPPRAKSLAGAFLQSTALFGFAVVFLLSAVTLNLLNAVLRRLRLGRLGGEVLYRYVGDVKVYQDRGRPGRGPLEDRGLPRRVAIRRRMVAALVAAARAEYDRWYVLGHGLGSVVAFNGLMETAHALPNYLSRTELADAGRFRATDPDADPGHVKRMAPRRPVWIDDDREGLDRRKLFRKLRGFATYGSPLDEFAFLWPQIVNVNNDGGAFPERFEWINVFDHTDPVASRIDAFDDAFGPGRGPRNFAYKASRTPLWSHTRYLKGGASPDSASRRLLDWMLGEAPFECPRGGPGSRWYKSRRPWLGVVLRLWMWLLLVAPQSAAIGGIAAWLLREPISAILGNAVHALGAACVIVLVVGCLRWLLEVVVELRRAGIE